MPERPAAPRTATGASIEIAATGLNVVFTHQPKEFIMRSKLAIPFILLVVLGGASTFLTACNTVAGAGKDVSKAGSEVSEEANEHK
jgi:predicted small secreted protein